jgi:hypothetical protein
LVLLFMLLSVCIGCYYISFVYILCLFVFNVIPFQRSYVGT